MPEDPAGRKGEVVRCDFVQRLLLHDITWELGMPRKFLYFPFTNFREDSVMRDIKSRYIKKYGEDVALADSRSSLESIEDEEMLIIAAHGSNAKPDRSSLWLERTGGTWDSITANKLAENLAKRGLRKTHRYLKLVSCYGAGDLRVTTGFSTVATRNFEEFTIEEFGTTTKCFASVFAKALGLGGYNQVKVKAYPGKVFNDAQREVKVTGSGFYNPSSPLPR